MSARPTPEARSDRSVPGERLFRLALLAHPAAFRRRYARDMVDLYRDGWHREAAGRGAGARLAYAIRAAAGALRTGLEQRSAPSAGALVTDLRYGARTLVHRPLFTLVVVSTLALGIGANTAVFTVLDATLLAPLPWRDGDRIVRLYVYDPEFPDDLQPVTAPGFVHFREHATALEGMAALYTYSRTGVDLTDGEAPERVPLLAVTPDYFQVMGAAPMIGRSFTESEARAAADGGGERIALVSQRIWERYLDGSGEIVGRTVTLNGRSHTVLGVMPDGFRDPVVRDVDVFVPQNVDLTDPQNDWDNFYLTVVGRLAAGVSVGSAQTEIDRLARAQWAIDPSEINEYLARLVPLRDDIAGTAEPVLLLLMGAVGLVLLIACVNVASLTLAAGSRRERELAIRSAIGSGRARLARQLLAESMLLAAAGAGAGLLLGAAMLRLLVRLAPAGLTDLADLSLDPRVFAFTAAVAMLSGIAFGLVPALRFSRTRAESVLREGGRSGAPGMRGGRTRQALVVAEVALALVLLVGAGILVKSFYKLSALDLNIDTDDVLTFQVNLPGARYGESVARAVFHRTFLERLRALPGVRAAGAVSWLPVTGSYHRWGTRRSLADGTFSEHTNANQRVVEGDYFEALDIPVLRGRTFAAEDTAEGPRRGVINQALAERLFPDSDPLGGVVQTGPWPIEVIGIVADVPATQRGDVVPKLYHSHLQFADNRNWALTYTVETEGPPSALVGAARSALAELDPALVLHEPTPFAAVIGRGVAYERFAMMLLGAFSAVALALAVVGIYGVLAQSVSARRQEFGVRLAVGATSPELLRLVLRHGLRLTLAGVTVGLLAALVLARLLGALVFDVSVTDPAVYALVTLALLTVAAAACALPARRATRVQPLEAFRGE